MPNWYVTIPIAGSITVLVRNAVGEAAAIAKGFEEYEFRVVGEGDTECEDCEVFEQIVEGNVFHGSTNEASAEETEDE